MTTQTNDKHIKVVTDVDFNENEIKNAIIDSDENSISNISTKDFKSGVLQQVIRDSSNASESALVSEKATRIALNNKQDTLISGTNIKTINNQSILGSGNIEGGLVDDVKVNGESVVENKVANITVPNVYNSTITINQGGELKGSFNLNQNSNETINLDSLVAGENIIIEGSTISAVVPTVNNPEIIVQKNSSTIGSFTLNQASNTTININVPTNVSQLNNDSNYQTGSQVSSSISSHNTSNTAHNDIRLDINSIDELIPNQASTTNQLADKNFVNSSIATNTANFIGTFNSIDCF